MRTSINHPLRKLSPEGRAAIAGALAGDEAVQVVVRGTFGTAFLATDRRVLVWKKQRLHEFRWENIADVALGGGPLVRWLQVRGPSVGLVRPSLLNIGALVDTVQFGEAVSDEARAALAMLVRQRAMGEPRVIATTEAVRPASPAASSDADQVLMKATGAGGHLLLLRDRVRIRHTGFRGLFRESLPAERELLLAQMPASSGAHRDRCGSAASGFKSL